MAVAEAPQEAGYGSVAPSGAGTGRRTVVRGAGLVVLALCAGALVAFQSPSGVGRDELAAVASVASGDMLPKEISQLKARLAQLEASHPSAAPKVGAAKQTALAQSSTSDLKSKLEKEHAHDELMTKTAASLARDVEQLRSQVTQLEARDLAQQKQSTGETGPKQQHLAAKASETTSPTSYDDEASDDSIGKSLQALKAKMQRMRASSRNEQHASSSKQQLSSDSASKLTPLTQFTDSHIQNGAAVPLTEGIKKNVHANPESCLRPRQDRKPTEDDYDCLEREIKELEKRESQRIAARKQAIKKAYDATSDEACDEYASPRKKAGCMKAHKQLAWRQAKDKYERAALTDIVNSDHSQDFRNVNDVAFKATQQEILHNKKLAEEFSGKKEYSQLNKQAEKSEQLRSTAEKSAMTLLRTEKHELEKVHREEMQDLEAKDHKKQAAKTEIVMNHVAKDGDRELYLNPLDESSSTKSTLDHSDAVADGIKAEENAEAHPEISVSSHSQRELSAARNIEQRRQKAFHEEVSALRKADRGVRAKAASSPTSLSHLSQYEKDEQAAMLKSLHATDQEQARRAKEIQKLRVRTAADQKAADAKADQALARAQVESGYRAIGLVSPPVSSSLKMSDDYHADVALASAEDSKRQSAWRAKRQDEISKEGRADAQRQAAASEQTESALRDQNHAAGYSETKVDNAVADALAEHERPAPKALPVQTARHSAEAATSETAIREREAEVNQIFKSEVSKAFTP